MIINYLDVQHHDAEGRTDEQVAASINNDPRTSRRINLKDLRLLLRNEDLLMLGIDGAWTGSLRAAYDSLPSELQVAINKLASIIQHETDPIGTTDLADATEFRAAADGLLAATKITQQQYDKLFAIGGGPRYSGVTAQDVAAARSEYQREHGVSLLLNAVQNAAITAKQIDGWTVESVKTAMLSALEA